MTTETTQFTATEIQNMTHDQWVRAGKPVRPFAERYGITREEVRAKLDTLVVGEVYEAGNSLYLYEGGERSYLKNSVACQGHTPLTDHMGEFTNVQTILSVRPSKVTKEEFANIYSGSSNSMAEWCEKNTCN